MKSLINKIAHACGLYTADDVEHIEKHWRERLDKATKSPRHDCHRCINYGWGMPQCRECNPGNNWKYFQKDL